MQKSTNDLIQELRDRLAALQRELAVTKWLLEELVRVQQKREQKSHPNPLYAFVYCFLLKLEQAVRHLVEKIVK